MDIKKKLFLKRNQSLQGADHSQGIVEFALALPVLLMLLFAIIDFSLLFSAWLLIQNMSRQAVRYAVTTAYDQAYCEDRDCTVDGPDRDYARIQSIHDVANTYRAGMVVDDSATRSDPGYLQIVVCARTDTTGPQGKPDGVWDTIPVPGEMGTEDYSVCQHMDDGSTGEIPGRGDDEVSVLVDFNSPFITPFLQLLTIFAPPDSLQSWKMTHLVSVQSGIVEKFRVSEFIPTRAGMHYTWTPSNTPTKTYTYTYTETFTPSITASPTSLEPTDTPTLTMTRTSSRTPRPTRTPTNTRPTSTRTNTRPTDTPTNTYTVTNTRPTNTPTRTYTRTNTRPTSTFTLTRTRTNTVPTSTSTRTFTRTNTQPTNTYTLTRTRTNTVPTSTRTYTYTVTNTRTATKTQPTGTKTPTTQATKTRTNTPLPTIDTDG
jgi:hypothetical protein